MYIAYLPKIKGEKLEDRNINNFLKFYIEKSNKKYSVIAAPGYMSTRPKTIDKYLTNLSRILNYKNKTKIGILNGMNGHHDNGSGTPILKNHNDLLSKHGFEQIKLNANTEFDHRKMMCFVTANNIPNEITLNNLEDFLNVAYVGGILIGSSNQSNTSYFSQNASKGEADIFMFDDSYDLEIKRIIKVLKYNEQTDDYPKELTDVVLTESFFGKGHNDTQSFFKEILKNVLENGLEE